MRLSILSTLRATFVLWMRHWRFFVLLAFFLGSLTLFGPEATHYDGLTLWNAVRNVAGFVLPLIFQAIGMAAFLNLVANPSSDKPWLVMVRGVGRYAGRLVWVQMLLLVIGILLMIPVGMISLPLMRVSVELGFAWTILGELVLVLFLKYALADPLVVAKTLKATTALGVSWRMTRNHFMYVFGCYLMVEVIEKGVGYGLIRLAAIIMLECHRDISSWLGFVIQFLDTFWYALPWIMYQRIKAAGPVPAATVDVFRPAIDAPPEGA